MNNSIFDLIESETPKSGKEGFMDLAASAPSVKDNSFWSQVQDYGKSILKGAAEGVVNLGQMLGPTLPSPHRKNGKLTFPEQQNFTEQLEEAFPGEEGFGQKAIRRGLAQAPTAIAFPGSGALQAGTRAGLAGLAGQTAEELGAPKWAQTIAEIGAYIGPDITKKLLAEGKNKELIEAGRKLGMTDEQLTPLLQSERKQRFLSKLAPKRGKTQKVLKETKTGLGKAYEAIKNSQQATSQIPTQSQDIFFNKMGKLLEDMPANVRNKIYEDAKDLVSKPITGQTLINFYQDINANLGHKTQQLTRLKKPIQEALSSISPELGQDFSNLNKLYGKYFPIANKLKPKLADDILSGVEKAGVLGSFIFGYPIPLAHLAGQHTLRKISSQMLLNPRFQQHGKKLVEALNQNKFSTAKKVIDLIAKEIKPDSEEIYDYLNNISEDEIKELFSYVPQNNHTNNK